MRCTPDPGRNRYIELGLVAGRCIESFDMESLPIASLCIGAFFFAFGLAEGLIGGSLLIESAAMPFFSMVFWAIAAGAESAMAMAIK
jgi:hypothetical protein